MNVSFTEIRSTISNQLIVEDEPDKKIIDLSFLVWPCKAEMKLDINDLEVLTQYSFKELIEEKEKENLPFLLSLLKSKGTDGKRMWHPFESCALIKARKYGNIENPLTSAEVKKILYFKIDTIKSKKFSFLGEENINAISGSFEEFIHTLIKANENDIWACKKVASFYLNGTSTPVDIAEAFKYMKIASDNGDVKALIKIGKWYTNENWIQYDPKKAFKCFQKALEQASDKNEEMIFYRLGVCYEKGVGVKPNLKKAIKYFQQASDKGFEKATNKLEKYAKTINETKRNKRKLEESQDPERCFKKQRS